MAEVRNNRVTMNFKYLSDCGFSEEQKEYLLNEAKGTDNAMYDKRNGIWCIINMDKCPPLQLYKNYISYINSNYDNWNAASPCFSYLDMGLVPVLWAPSFMQGELYKDVTMLVEQWHIDLVFLPSSSLLQRGYVGGTKDVWVRKTDLAKILDVPIEKATLSTLLKKIS